MREISVAAHYVATHDENLTDDVFDHAAQWPDQQGFSRRVGERWEPVTYREFADEVVKVAAGLMAFGVGAGDRVALLSRTRFEWMVCDFAIWAAGGVTVPVYETSSAEQVEWILGDSGAVAAIVETEDHAKTVAQVRIGLPELREVWVLDAGGMDELIDGRPEVPAEAVLERRRTVTSDALATIIYTSGTTGRPKGCSITHANLLAEVHNVCTADGVQELVFNRAHPHPALPAARPHPGSIHPAGAPCTTGSIWRTPATSRTSRRSWSSSSRPPCCRCPACSSGSTTPPSTRRPPRARPASSRWRTRPRWTTARHGTPVAQASCSSSSTRVFDHLVYTKLRAAIGGDVRWAVSGGAPLGARLGHFFRGIGITVLEGYGLTETCAGITLNLPDAQHIGSVGRPIPGCSVRIADDGEVLLKGGNVFVGYWHNDEATREVFDADGWFRSGDLGELDGDGYLTITGRKKDIIVTSSGKNVAPTVLEDRLRSHWLVSQCLVVGDARPFIAALITIDADAFEQWKTEAGKQADATVADLRDDPDLLAALQAAVDDANKAVSSAEAIKKFRVLEGDFTEEGGELTPTLKVKRNVVFATFGDEVDALYVR